MFSVNLVYSGLFQFMNVRHDDIEPLIWVECPRLLFPFSRQILAEITREGGYPPLLINPIDFTPLYWGELRERQSRSGVPLAKRPAAPSSPSARAHLGPSFSMKASCAAISSESSAMASGVSRGARRLNSTGRSAAASAASASRIEHQPLLAPAS